VLALIKLEEKWQGPAEFGEKLVFSPNLAEHHDFFQI
jgi:hypothetical protein